MNATELFLKDGRTSGIYFCGECRIVHPSEDRANKCCTNPECSKCGVDTGERYYTVCEPCRRAEETRNEQERFEKAEKISSDKWGGWVFLEGAGYNNGYFESVSDYLDWHDGNSEDPLPEYLWTCTETPFVVAYLDDVIENVLNQEGCPEDFDPDDINGIDELKAAIKKFNEDNEGTLSYFPDYKKAVLIKKEEQA